MFGCIRTLHTIAQQVYDGVGLLFFPDRNFFEPRDEWLTELEWADRLADKEAEEEVTEPAYGVCVFCFRPSGSCDHVERFCASSAGVSPLPAEEQPPCSASRPGVEQGGSQLTADDLLDASFAAHSYSGRCTRDDVAAKWSRLGNRLFNAAK